MGEGNFTRNGGEASDGGGGGVIMGGWEIFEVFLHSWQWGANPPYFMKTLLYCLCPFFKFRPTSLPLSCHLQPPPPLSGFSLLGGSGKFLPTSQKFAHSPHLEKYPPVDSSPHQIFIPPPPTKHGAMA